MFERCVYAPTSTMETLYNKSIRYKDVGGEKYYNTSDPNGENTENRLPLGDPTVGFTLGYDENFSRVGYFETFNDGVTYNDYLTFSNDNSGYGVNPSVPSKFSNIHIAKMNYETSSLAHTNGLLVNDSYMLGVRNNPVSMTSPMLGKHYSDVVIFPNSPIKISDIHIGENTYGVTINSDANFINIGNGCTNISIGVSFNNGTYQTNQNINIGDFNENIDMNQDINSVEIGSGNKNVSLLGQSSRDIKIGNYNQQLYCNDAQFLEIGDSNLRNIVSGDIRYLTMGNNNQDNDIMNCIYNFDMGDNNYDNVLKFVLNGSFKSNCIRNGIYDSKWIDLDINGRDNFIRNSAFITVGTLNQFILASPDGTAGNDIYYSNYVDIGKESYFNKITSSNRISIGDYSRNTQVIGSDNKIGDSCIDNRVLGNNNFVLDNCASNFILQSNNTTIKENSFSNIINDSDNCEIGIECDNNTLKGNCDNNKIGNYCKSNFFEDSKNNIVGDYSSYNIFNTTNVKYDYVVDTTINYAVDAGIDLDEYLIQINNVNVQINNVKTLLVTSNTNLGSNNNKIGNESSNNHFISSSQNVIGDNSSYNRLGGEVNETFANSSGCGANNELICPFIGTDAVILAGKYSTSGEVSNNNVIGNNSNYNEFVNSFADSSGTVTTAYINGAGVEPAFQTNYDTIHSNLNGAPFTFVNEFDGVLAPGDARTTFYSLGHSYNNIGHNVNYIKFNSNTPSYYNNIISCSNEMIISGTLNNVSVVINGEGEQRMAYNYSPANLPLTGFRDSTPIANLNSVVAGTDFITGNYSNISVHLRDTATNDLWYQDITGGTLNTPTQFN